MKLSIKYFLSKCDQSFLQFSEDLVTFTEEILNGKLQNFCAVIGWAPSFYLLEIVAQKGLLVLLHLGLESATEVDIDP